MAAFAVAADLATYTSDTTLSGPRGTLLLEQSSAIIRTYCRQTFDLVTDDLVELRGTWSNRLHLPERPVVSVASVDIDGYGVTGYQLVRDVLHRHSNWGGPTVTVNVTYTHGFAPGTPAMETLKAVCLQIASRAAANTGGKSQEAIGNWSASWTDGGGLGLTSAEQFILDRYRHEYATA